MNREKDGLLVSTDPARLDRDAVHEFLRTSYWARGIPRDVLDRSIDNALCFGLYEGVRQVGFARHQQKLRRVPNLVEVGQHIVLKEPGELAVATANDRRPQVAAQAAEGNAIAN